MVVPGLKIKLQFFLIGLLLVPFGTVNAQSYYHFLVEFTDKAETTFSVQNPLEFLSSDALERRALHSVEVLEEDLPIVQRYLDSLKDYTIEAHSKWFNNVVIGTNDSLSATQLIHQSFIEKITLIGVLSNSNKKSRNNWDYGGGENQTDMVNGSFLHNLGYDGKGVLISVLDVGFKNANTIAAFDSLRLNNQLIATYDFVENELDVFEDPSHGTSVLSTMGSLESGKLVGSAPRANFVLLCSEDESQENLIEEFHYIEALEYSDSIGARIINSSLGYNTFDYSPMSHQTGELVGDSSWISKAVNKVVSKGVFHVQSAGNEAGNSWKYVAFPSDADSAFTIGSVTAAGELSTFSSHGIPTYHESVKPNVVLQGSQAYLVLGNGNYTPSNGTSFSAPQMAGWIACLMQAFPEKKIWELKKAIEVSAHQYAQPDSLQGYGIPDLEKAYYYLKYNKYQAINDVGLLVFPNPTNCASTIISESAIEFYQIIDASGKVVQEHQCNSHLVTVDLGQFSAGVYTIVVRCRNGVKSSILVKY